MKIVPKSITPLERTPEAFRRALLDNLYYVRGQAIHTASAMDLYWALAHTVRNYMMMDWQHNVDAYFEQNPKFVYYLSAEYLLGQQLSQNLVYTETEALAREALKEFDVALETMFKLDIEPGLGNGGLGRLAACFMDSLATLDIPAVGYGIRYEYGIFKQNFSDGWQVESPDEWLFYGNPWEFAQPDDRVEIGFGGSTETYLDESGNFRMRWLPGETILGEPYHTMVPGYQTKTINMLRLWRARATKEFDFQLFDVGDYAHAVEQRTRSENISKVLYPNDSTVEGRELRLRQQYFFVACSLHDILQRFRIKNTDWTKLPEIAVIQLNDTHPVIAIPELMRVLLDEQYLEWDTAWNITTRTIACTQHTLLPEALEKWPVWMMEKLLPRHMQIIYEINHRFLSEVRSKFPGDEARVTRMSIIEEGSERRVRMSYLACVASFSINGVAELQTKLLKEQVLSDFYELWSHKFNNKTNGVTPRRWLRIANPLLTNLITETIGNSWLKDLDQLKQLEPYATDAGFRDRWMQVKQQNKVDLAAIIHEQLNLTVNPDSIFDVMVKRLHEYKRQLLKVLHIITLYERLKANPQLDMQPITFIFGAKAAPGYHMAKQIIKLINAVGEMVNYDADVRDRLKVAYLPNFNVTLGERIYPAANLSEQISLAGKEASGTGNMKFALNGAVTIGTLDGANIEIRARVGDDNFFLFGLTTEEVFTLKASGYRSANEYRRNAELRQVLERLASGYFAGGDAAVFDPIVQSLVQRDDYLLLADYHSYVEAYERVMSAYSDSGRWAQMSILNTARCGFFSSDRTIRQYCGEIWGVKPLSFGN
jgi:starch phosphorylase